MNRAAIDREPGATRLRLLGPVALLHHHEELALGPGKQRTVFAVLAVGHGHPVPATVAIDRVWGDDPPPAARNALNAYIARLRRLLRVTESVGGDRPVRITRTGSAYRLEVRSETVDLAVFRSLRTRALTAGISDADRMALLDRALGLVVGPPLGGIPGQWAERARISIEAEIIEAACAWGRAGLRLGDPDPVVTRLRGFAETYPSAEPLAEVLVRALRRAGRDADAIAAYRVVRARLREELDLEPGPTLRAQYDMLRQGRAPAQLPAPVTEFAGRTEELATLDRWAGPARGSGATVVPLVIAAITGTAGVGKTALAVRWAHREQGCFPDGQLFLDLHGYDQDAPMPVEDALGALLRSLGRPEHEVPSGRDARSTALRAALAGRRMLLLLDNAADAEQVRPLLPGTASCVVVMTSRDSLAGLVAREGARRMSLGRLPRDDAAALLSRLVGARADAEPDAVQALITACARLPLALRIAAERALAQPSARLAGVAAEVSRDRLGVLGDVRTVLSGSYRHLPAGAAEAFRAVGAHPSPHVDAAELAARIHATTPDARRRLELLVRAHLIEPAGEDRYAMHDLLRVYARECQYEVSIATA